MEKIICHNQSEFDEAIKQKNSLIVLQDTTEKIVVSVEAWGNSSVVARENSSVVAWGNSSGIVFDNAHILVVGELYSEKFKKHGN